MLYGPSIAFVDAFSTVLVQSYAALQPDLSESFVRVIAEVSHDAACYAAIISLRDSDVPVLCGRAPANKLSDTLIRCFSVRLHHATGLVMPRDQRRQFEALVRFGVREILSTLPATKAQAKSRAT